MEWEFKIVVDRASNAERAINRLAADGWEAVSIGATIGGVAVLMRRKRADTP